MFGAAMGILLSIALTGAAVTGSFFVPTKTLGVLVSAAGCFAAGWMFAGFFRRAIGVAKQEESSCKAVQEELAKVNKAKSVAENRIAELEAETLMLKNQKINIDAMYPVLRLGLCEAEMSVKDVKLEWMEDFDDQKIVGVSVGLTPTRSQYVGVLQRSFKATYGVDLTKLHVREDGDCIFVAGIEAESIGLKDDKSDWLIRQSQQYDLKKILGEDRVKMSASNLATEFMIDGDRYEIDRAKSFKGDFDLNKVDAYCKKQEEDLRNRINKGVGGEFSSVNNYIQKMAEGFVRVLLSPVGKEIRFETKPSVCCMNDSGWKKLEDYVNAYNQNIIEMKGEGDVATRAE